MQSMNAYNWVDYIILGIFFASVLAGLARGAAKEIMSLLSWIAAFVVATLFCHRLAAFFTQSPAVQSAIMSASGTANPSEQISWLALGGSFVLLFVITLVIGTIFGHLISSAVDSSLGLMNRLLGAGFGLARGFLVNLILIFLVQLVPNVQQETWWAQSSLVRAYQPAVQSLAGFIQPSLDAIKSKAGQTLDNMSNQLQQNLLSN